MSGFTCSSRAQCRLNGLFGTAVALCTLMLLWSGVAMLTSGAAPLAALGRMAGVWLTLLAPTSLSVLLWVAMRATGRQPGWLTSGFVLIGAVWGIAMLNGVARL
ncbi:hypothetical protein [Pseudodonghicola xiamenensis]|uniref:Uncharacterized protein n=1 Tax=Pseudodonghicola xiamenensis TaxID=337702 RepID=A0A8J3H5E2_9RHOB|nr:hypothetical protein [Pseudodonghicola xiamenensis]GHG89056.1 hypothetical protein GCM10010961_18580 [Pseudodonghicola xiamenensis]